MLGRVRQSLLEDGHSWSGLDGDRKLVLVWQRLERTEAALREAHTQLNSLKKEQKVEAAGIQEYLTHIRSVSVGRSGRRTV